MNRVNFRYFNDKSGIKPLTEDEKAFLKEVHESGNTHAKFLYTEESLKTHAATCIYDLSKYEENKDKKLTELMHEIYIKVLELKEAENEDQKN